MNSWLPSQCSGGHEQKGNVEEPCTGVWAPGAPGGSRTAALVILSQSQGPGMHWLTTASEFYYQRLTFKYRVLL